MAARPLSSVDLPADFPEDAIPALEVADRLGRSRRTVARWVSSSPGELTRYLLDQGAGQTRLYLSWAEVVSYCLKRDLLPLETLTFTPDAALSDAVAAPVSTPDVRGVASSSHVATPDSVPLDTDVVLGDEIPDAMGPVRGSVTPDRGAHTDAVALRAEVARLSALLQAAKDARQLAEAAHAREVALLESRLTEMKTAHAREVEGLQTARAREVATLTDELIARRGEAAEARQATERQQQREAALRWQAATLKGQRDQAVAELETWGRAGWLRRLLGRPRLLEAAEDTEGAVPVLLVEEDRGEG